MNKTNDGGPIDEAQQPHHLIPTAELTDEEMIELDNQAKSLVREAAEFFGTGETQAAAACVDQAIEKMQRVANEMNRQRKWIAQKIEEMRARQSQSVDPENNGTPSPDPKTDQ